jgi:hypothetical protein
MYPGGILEETGNNSDYDSVVLVFHDTYQHFGTAYWAISLAVFFPFIWYKLPDLIRGISKDYIDPIERAITISIAAPTIFSMLLPFVVLLVSFAHEVCPNIKYNIGGGQPQVVELQIGKEKPVVTNLPGISVYYEDNNQEHNLKTEPLVVWNQTDKF